MRRSVALFFVLGCGAGRSPGADATQPTEEIAGDAAGPADAEDVAVEDVPARSGPRIDSLEPAELSFRGGETLVITGHRLSGATAVTLDGVPAMLGALGSDTLTVETPGSSRGGLLPLRVETPDGSAEASVRVRGVPPPLLRFVEVDGALDLAAGEHLLVLSAPSGPRLLVWGGPTLTLLERDSKDHWRTVSVTDLAANAVAVCAADFDGDGDADPFVATDAGSSGIHEHSEAGLGAPLAGGLPDIRHAACGSLGPGLGVVVVIEPSGAIPAVRAFLSDAALGLALAPASTSAATPATGVALGDLDGDGLADLVVGRTVLPPLVLRGDGAGAFLPVPVGHTPTTETAAVPVLLDAHGDGAPDIFFLGGSGPGLWRGDGKGRFYDETSLSVALPGAYPTALLRADVDLDGADDLVAATSSRLVALRNDGAGRLFDYSDAVITRLGAPEALGVAVLDADGDLDPDLVVTRATGPSPVLLRGWAPLPFDDPDLDQLPSVADGCPADFDPEQENRDTMPFACLDCAAELGCQRVDEVVSGAAYLVCRADGRTRDGAERFCKRRGAQLLSLSSPAEATLLAGEGSVWLDLRDTVTEGSFLTTNGQPPSFTQWASSQPDDAGGLEDCVEWTPGGWNDLPCDALRGVICETVAATLAPDPPDACDVCPLLYDPQQLDADGDGFGDPCDLCPAVPDPGQLDGDDDGVGDLCEAP